MFSWGPWPILECCNHTWRGSTQSWGELYPLWGELYETVPHLQLVVPCLGLLYLVQGRCTEPYPVWESCTQPGGLTN